MAGSWHLQAGPAPCLPTVIIILCHLTSKPFCNAAPLNIDETLAMHGMQGSGYVPSPFHLASWHVAGLPTSDWLGCDDVLLDSAQSTVRSICVFLEHVYARPLG